MRNLIFIAITLFMICTAAYARPGKDGPVSGKMYFSNQPFTTSNAGSRNNFTSTDFIYGRIELDGQTIKEAFKIGEPNSSYPYTYLLYRITVFYKGEEKGTNPLNVCLLKEEDRNKTWLNFDVLPEPSKATTVLSGVERFSAGLFAAPLYYLIGPRIYDNGEYKIVVKIYAESYDVWGNREDLEKWPRIEDEFTFMFNDKDVPLLKKNDKAADAVIQQNAFKLSKLPEVFTHSAKVNDAKLTSVKIAAILKRDMPNWTVLKFAIEPVSGPVWLIEKDDYRLIKLKYLSSYVHVAYKKDGSCYAGYLQLVEMHQGGGRYGPLQVGFTSSSARKDNAIDCIKVK